MAIALSYHMSGAGRQEHKARSVAAVMEMVVGVTNFGVEMITVRDEYLSGNCWLDNPLATSPLLVTAHISQAAEVIEAGVEAVAASYVIAV